VSSYATAEQLRHRLQRDAPFAGDELISAEQALEDVTGALEDHIPGGVLQRVDHVWEDDVHARTVWLPHAPKVPVIVTVVELDGDELDGEDWKKTRLHGVRRVDGHWWSGKIKVTYTYGYPEGQIPNGLRKVALDMAAASFSNPESVLQMRMGSDRSVSFADSSEAAGGLSRANRRILDTYLPAAV
jgi:hypothetical protein